MFVGKIISDFSECFSDLDEITARYIQPMNDYVQEIGKFVVKCIVWQWIIYFDPIRTAKWVHVDDTVHFRYDLNLC